MHSNPFTNISISVVSHRQIDLIESLLQDIETHCLAAQVELILTHNLEESTPFDVKHFTFPIKVIRNSTPMGFAANHNQAFLQSSGQFFCVLNPDIRLNADPFQVLIPCLKDSAIGVSAPLIIGKDNHLEDSARRFPTPFKILCKVLGGCKGSDYAINEKIIYPDWVGGMFMLFRREIFAQLRGFDQRYFLYYEDVDICARLRLLGYEVALCPATQVIHHAQRSSHRNLKYLKWHLMSMLRFFCSTPFLKFCWLRLTNRI
jgi:N-acetylglucosaminyl-diphospho-decaprenol L-rhamnosyltransferase